MSSLPEKASWLSLLEGRRLLPLGVLVTGILLHSMNVLLTATVLPSVVAEVGGVTVMSWATTGFLAASIVAATCTSLVTATIGARRAYFMGASIFCAGAILCASAPSMYQLVAGRLVQGFGGGFLSALAYVLVRNVFPTYLWARVFALLSGVWGVSIVVGPLLGGVFAGHSFWRGAFITVAILAALVAMFAVRALPADVAAAHAVRPRVPVARVGLVCLAIVAMSVAGIAEHIGEKVVLLAAAVCALVAMLRLDRRAEKRLMPSDAFSIRSTCGLGLWMVLLMSITYTPMPNFGPLFLQRLHGYGPLAAGYIVATQSFAWTAAAMITASASDVWVRRIITCAPLLMLIGLCGIALVLGPGPVLVVIAPVLLVGTGIGSAWAFITQRVMHGAREGEGDVAAASVAVVQQSGLAFGAALSGLVANVAGLAGEVTQADLLNAAFWVPLSFVAAAGLAFVMGVRLALVAPRTPKPIAIA